MPLYKLSYWHKPPAANNAKQELIKVTILVALLRAQEAKGYRIGGDLDGIVK